MNHMFQGLLVSGLGLEVQALVFLGVESATDALPCWSISEQRRDELSMTVLTKR